MNTPFRIALLVNGINIALDWPFIFGWGQLPAMGVGGAALASVLSQWVGAVWATMFVIRQLGWSSDIAFKMATDLLKVGRDLFMRTGLLMLFLLFTTRIATQIGPDSGAAHQAIRQVWVLMALVLEAYAMAAQSLVGYFLGAGDRVQARRVAAVSSQWSVVTGVLLTVAMWLMTDWVIALFVPETAVSTFTTPWLIAALFQPLNAIAFVTDGIHWGTADYRYLRNGMFAATLVAGLCLLFVDRTNPSALNWVWGITAVWIIVRAIFGFIRIWPGVGKSPFVIPIINN